MISLQEEKVLRTQRGEYYFLNLHHTPLAAVHFLLCLGRSMHFDFEGKTFKMACLRLNPGNLLKHFINKEASVFNRHYTDYNIALQANYFLEPDELQGMTTVEFKDFDFDQALSMMIQTERDRVVF